MYEKTRVLLICADLIPSIILCGHVQLEELDRQGVLEYRMKYERALRKDDLEWSDIVIFGRSDSSFSVKVARKLKDSGRKLFYIIDDDLLNVPAYFSSGMHYAQKSVKKYIRAMLDICDGIITPSLKLKELYAAPGKSCIIVDEPAVLIKSEIHQSHYPIKIGVAGSVDRTGDVENILEGALKRIKTEYGDKVQFEFFGAIPDFAKELDADVIPFCSSYDEYLKRLHEANWDIGLAPMPDSSFHECKHFIKYIEYSSAGICTICSDVVPYIRLKEYDSPAVFCKNTLDDWYSSIKGLLDNLVYLQNCRQYNMKFIYENLSVGIAADRFLRNISSEYVWKENEKVNISFLKCMYVETLVYRLMAILKVYGFRTPLVLFKKIKNRLM